MMKQNKKINPRQKPLTMAELERAKRETKDKALITVTTIFLTVLLDKFNGANYIHDVWLEANKLADSISKGYVSLSDLRYVLRKEYKIDTGKWGL